MNDKSHQRIDRPNLVGNYRPVAIRSVIAAHTMIPAHRPEPAVEPPTFAADFALPAGFHNPAED